MTDATTRVGAPRRPGWFLGGLAGGAAVGALVFLLTAGAAAVPGPAEPTVPRFVEETIGSGIRHVYDGGSAYFVGGGVAAFDCDDDRRPDLYLAGGGGPAGLYRNESATGGDLRFAHVPDPTTDLGRVTGAYPLDIDADGHLDLAVLRVGENVLLRGLGDCRFERANEAWGFEGGDDQTVAFSATWEDPSGMPTLAFGNYLEQPPSVGDAPACADSVMFRPTGSGQGYRPPITLAPGLCTLSVLFTDWDRSGRHDLRMSNDRHYYGDGEEQLWRVEPGAQPSLYTRMDGWQELRIWGMGIAAHDVTGDGLPEFFLTSQGDNRLQTLTGGAGRPEYEDIALRRGVTAHRPFMGDPLLPSTAWHPEFADVNNDGLTDLSISKGNVAAQGDHAAEDPSNLLLANPDGTFTERAREAGIVSLGRSRGAAVVDFNLDGMLDLVEVNRGQSVRLWRNTGTGDADDPGPLGHWVALRLEQPSGNRDGVGGWLEVRADALTHSRQLTVGGGHAGGQLGWVHVGLGDAEHAEVRVQWPDGETGPWLTVDAGRFAVIERGAPDAVTWSPPGS